MLKHQLHKDDDDDGGDVDCEKLRFSLGRLKTFVLICGRKLGIDASLRCFLGRIEDIVRKNAEQIHRQLDDHRTSFRLISMSRNFTRDIEALEKEIDEWHLKVLDKQSTTTCSAAADEVLGIITSFLQNLFRFRSLTLWGDYIEMEQERLCIDYVSMEQEISFMKSLLGFVSKICVVQVEPLKDLSAHADSVVIPLIHLFFRSVKHLLEEGCYEQLPTGFHVYEIYIRTLSSSKLQTPLLASTDQNIMDDDTLTAIKDFLDSLISNLWDLLRLNTFKDDLKELYEELRSLRSLVKHQQLQLQRPKIKLDYIGEVVCDAGVFICSLHLNTHTEDENHLMLLQDLLNTLRSILVESGAEQHLQVEAVDDDQFSIMASQGEVATNPLSNEPVCVGFRDDQTLIVDQLTKGSPMLQIIAIVGMPGIGKTTLATKVYTNPCVLDYFSVRAWSTVSQVVDQKKVLLDLFNQIDPIKCSEMSGKPQPDFADGLRKSLKKKKYLIFLDDMWNEKAWLSLSASFPKDNVGSRIILTSRQYDVVPHDLMVDRKPHSLRQLNEEESLELFQSKLSSRNGGLPSLSRELGMKIAGKCRGLPLMIIIVAGVLKSKKPEDWNEILDGMRNDHMHYRNTLELSYNHLQPHLKPCFLYFGTFKEDEEVSVKRLLRLWIAEGFIQTDNTKSPEEAAERYLRDLVERSLIMVVKQRSVGGGVKACRIHDLLYEFCIQKAKDEHLFHFLKDYDELSAFNEPHTLQRLCIQSETLQDFTESRLFCPRVRSLIHHYSQSKPLKIRYFNISSTIQITKRLKVLDLERVELGYMFPSEIEHLVQLAFLALRCLVREIPQFMGKLLNLETFILQQGLTLPTQLPDSLWDLQKLQYLCINNDFGCYLPQNYLESSSTLAELERYSGANIPSTKMKNLLEKIPNVYRLKCVLSREKNTDRRDAVDHFDFEILKQLESLNLRVGHYKAHFCDLFSFPATLKKLTLKNVKLSSISLSTIGQLPKLEVLKLYVHFEGETWEMKEEEYPKLRILTLSSLTLVKWVTSDDNDNELGCFEKLVLYECKYLQELPSCLDIIPTLDVIEVSECYFKQVNLVRQIKERREAKVGDSSLKIITGYIYDSNSDGD